MSLSSSASAASPTGGLGFADPAALAGCNVNICPIESSFYNYRINLGANVAFLVCFSVLLCVFPPIWLFTRRGHFFTGVMIPGLVLEILGYVGRVWSYNNQWDENAYFMQIICLTLAPAFFSAGIYVCLARLVIIYGKENSIIKPLWYTYIFIPCDILALVLQAAGGAISATALTEGDLSSFTTGNNILTAGLSWQVFTLFCFICLCGEFAFRVRHRIKKLGSAAALSQDPASIAIRESRLFKGFLFALGLSTLLIFWRCCYRVAELNDGFTGPITYKQGLFIGFEGVIIVAAVAALAIMHPAICMGKVMSVPLKEKSGTPPTDGSSSN